MSASSVPGQVHDVADGNTDVDAVGTVGIHEGEHALEVAGGACGDELFGHPVGVGRRDARATLVGGVDGASGAARQLTTGRGAAAQDLADGVEGVAEHVVEDERDSLGRRQLGHHDLQRQPHLVVQRDAVSRIHVWCCRRGEVVQGSGASPLPVRRAQPVEAEAAHDDGEPSAHVVDLVEVLVDESREGLLHGVFRFVHAAEHPKGDVEEVAVVVTPGATEPSVELELARVAHAETTNDCVRM